VLFPISKRIECQSGFDPTQVFVYEVEIGSAGALKRRSNGSRQAY
jgi:hypothetical protein